MSQHGNMDLEHQQHKIVSPKVYLLVFGILLVCTVLTAAVAFVDLGVFNAVIALAIAVFKASLVVLFFMHIHYSNKLIKLTVTSGIFIFLVLLTMIMTDYISRAWGMW